MAKEKYSKPIKKAAQEILESGISVGELEAIIADPRTSASKRMAAILVLKETTMNLATPQGMQTLAKLTGDFTEEVNVNTNAFTEMVKKVQSEDGSEW